MYKVKTFEETKRTREIQTSEETQPIGEIQTAGETHQITPPCSKWKRSEPNFLPSEKFLHPHRMASLPSHVPSYASTFSLPSNSGWPYDESHAANRLRGIPGLSAGEICNNAIRRQTNNRRITRKRVFDPPPKP